MTASTPTTLPTSTAMPTPAGPLTLGAWHDMIYHEQAGKVVLVNGGPENGKATDDPIELWNWDGETWEWDGQIWICEAGCK